MENRKLVDSIKKVLEEESELTEIFGKKYTEEKFLNDLFSAILKSTEQNATEVLFNLVNQKESVLKIQIENKQAALASAIICLNLKDEKKEGEIKFISSFKLMMEMFPEAKPHHYSSGKEKEMFNQFIKLFRKYHENFDSLWVKTYTNEEYWELLKKSYLQTA